MHENVSCYDYQTVQWREKLHKNLDEIDINYIYISYNDILNFPYMKLMMLLGMKSAAAKAR